MPPGPLEQEIVELWRERILGAPGALNAAVERREDLTWDETIALILRLFGTAADADRLLAQEIDQLKT
jgi:hypothetical protein